MLFISEVGKRGDAQNDFLDPVLMNAHASRTGISAIGKRRAGCARCCAARVSVNEKSETIECAAEKIRPDAAS